MMVHDDYLWISHSFLENVTSFSFDFSPFAVFALEHIACRSCFLQCTVGSQTKTRTDSKQCCQINCFSQMGAPWNGSWSLSVASTWALLAVYIFRSMAFWFPRLCVVSELVLFDWVLIFLLWTQRCFTGRQTPKGRLGMSAVSPLSGISGLSFDSTLLSPLIFFCLILLPFLSCLFLPAGPFFRTFSRKLFNIFH